MMRHIHRWPGLVLAALLIVMSVSGTVLSFFPWRDAVQAAPVDAGMSAAQLAQRIQATHPGLEQITLTPGGQIKAWWFVDGQSGVGWVDPGTGEALQTPTSAPFQLWLTNLHRSLFLGDTGRALVAIGALGMVILAVSGVVLVARRAGGWRRWFAPVRGSGSGRVHTQIARLTVVGLLLSAATALWMTAGSFGWIDSEPAPLAMASPQQGTSRLAPARLSALQAVRATDLLSLAFPVSDDPQDVYAVETQLGRGQVDPGTGEWLVWQDRTTMQQWTGAIRALHTGEGLPWLGMLLGVMALGVPAMAVTGVVLWLAVRRRATGQRDQSGAAQAETVLLVGSEGGSTWGFAATLSSALRAAGQTVHVAPMAAFAPEHYRQARRCVLLAATCGSGDAPSSARGFLERLDALRVLPQVPLAVLGFGDRSFPAFCAYAETVERRLRARAWPTLLPFDTIDRQSPQDFARWGARLGNALGIPLDLVHQGAVPETVRLVLRERRDHGDSVQAPMAILRFAVPPAHWGQRILRSGFGPFEAGDLLGILPEGSAVPRLYSLASGSRDGFIEIVVRRHPGGLCSGQLTRLQPGEDVRGFLRPHPGFRVVPKRSPLILIGAGTGIAPLVGFIRANRRQRPIHLYFGLRHADSDFLYRDELEGWQQQGFLHRLSIAQSRGDRPQYVQDLLTEQNTVVRDALVQGARVMVCGGREMARCVAGAMTGIVQPAGMTVAMLREQGRYVEDIY